MRPRGRALLLALVVGMLLASCVAPARMAEAYQDKAADTASSVVSAARTVLLAARVGADRESFAPTVSILVAEGEGDALTARDTFATIQPPDEASDRLRASLLADLGRVVGVIAAVRIAARRGELDRLEHLAAPLRVLAERLDRFATRYG